MIGQTLGHYCVVEKLAVAWAEMVSRSCEE